MLRKITTLLDAPMVNLNLELSYRMLALTKRQRTLKLLEILMEIVEQTKAMLAPNTPAYDFNLLVFDNTELIFDRDLKQAPLRLLLDTPKDGIKDQVLRHLKEGTELGRNIRTWVRFVPYRFLRPFFAAELRGQPDSQVDSLISRLSKERFNSNSPCLYRFVT